LWDFLHHVEAGLVSTDTLIGAKDTELNTFIGGISTDLQAAVDTDITANILGTDATATLLKLLNTVVAN
jgi:hypothetical protein